LRSQWRSCGHRLGIAISGMWEIFKWATTLLTHYIQVWQPFEIPQKTLAFKNKNKQFWLLFPYAHWWQLGYLFIKYLSPHQTWKGVSDLITHHCYTTPHLSVCSLGHNVRILLQEEKKTLNNSYFIKITGTSNMISNSHVHVFLLHNNLWPSPFRYSMLI